MFFSNINNLLNTIVVGVLAYIAIVFLLRISGKRTLSKWNAFDFIVTVALGSSLATAILSNQVSLAQGITGFFILIMMQFLVTWLSVRVKKLQKFIKAEPVYLLKNGNYLLDNMKKERVTETEIRAALRGDGISDIHEAGAVILETDGSFSIIKKISGGTGSTLSDVRG
jgi:uncharacterized membrane protein YcaP (DUF421 family)